MLNINSYIIEKLKINSQTKITNTGYEKLPEKE